jgi:2-haloacid dehalogenase
MAHQAYVFDAYGTLFDVHAAVRKHADTVGADATTLSEMWRAKQLEYSWIRGMIGAYEDFWLLTEQALDFAFDKVPTANRSSRQALLDAYWTLDCYPEVPAALAELKANGAKLAILSNGSSNMLAAAVKSAGLDKLFDSVISVDRLSTFKANRAVYEMVTEDFDMQAGEISYQSSNRWDVAAAVEFGFRTVWINRTSQPDEYRDFSPAMVLEDLGEFGTDNQPV